MKFKIFNKLQIANYMYKYHHGLLPNYVNEMFSANNTNHTYNSRYGNQLRIPKHNTNIIKYTVSLAGPKIWNSIEPIFKTCHQLCSNNMLKQF